MTDEEQIAHFEVSLDALIDRHREEYDMNYASMIGALQLKLFLLCQEATDHSEEPDQP